MSYAALSSEEDLPPAIVREPEEDDGPSKPVLSGDDAPIVFRRDNGSTAVTGTEYGMWIWKTKTPSEDAFKYSVFSSVLGLTGAAIAFYLTTITAGTGLFNSILVLGYASFVCVTGILGAYASQSFSKGFTRSTLVSSMIFIPVGLCILVLLLGTIFIQSKRCPAQGSQSQRYDWFCDFSQGSILATFVFPLIILGACALGFLATWSASLHALSQQLSYEDGPLAGLQRKV